MKMQTVEVEISVSVMVAGSTTRQRIVTENDRVEIFEEEISEDGARGFRWRRRDTGNGKIVAEGSEAYGSRLFAIACAAAYCPGLPIFEVAEDS